VRRYIISRLTWFIPTLFLITLLAFVVNISAPGDPVLRMLDAGENQANNIPEHIYEEKKKELGLHLPLFYFKIASLAEPDTLHHVLKPTHQAWLNHWIYIFGNWEQIQSVFKEYLILQKVLQADSTLNYTDFDQKLEALKSIHDQTELSQWLVQIQNLKKPNESQKLLSSIKTLMEQTSTWKLYVPVIHWNGLENQYHRWLFGFFTGEIGYSYIDKRPVSDKLPEAMKWSLIINIVSILIAYLLAVPIGVISAQRRNQWADRFWSSFFFMLYSLPNFWIATLLIVFLAGGEFLNLFPAGNIQDTFFNDQWPWYQKLMDWIWHLILPVFCYTYASVAYLNRQMRSALVDTMQQDFIRTAKSKGLTNQAVMYKHALPNSLFPMITLFGSVFPALVGGSVILETIFSLPGAGFLSFQAIVAHDYPMLMALFTLTGIMTLAGIFIADLLYAWVDPRVKYMK